MIRHDVVIVGAGPAGVAASLAANKLGLKFVTLEQEDSIGGTTYHYPRNKIVMTAPMNLPLIGKIRVREVSKEALMKLWQDVTAKVPLPIRYNERMEEIRQEGKGFVVRRMFTDVEADIYVLADGDATYDAASAPRMIELLLRDRLGHWTYQFAVTVDDHLQGVTLVTRGEDLFHATHVHRLLQGLVLADVLADGVAGEEKDVRLHPGGSLGERLSLAISEVMLTGSALRSRSNGARPPSIS